MNIYEQIIKKQQELLDLYAQAGVNQDNMVNPQTLLKESKKVLNKYDETGFVNWMRKQGLSENSQNSYNYQVKLFFREFGEINQESLSQWENSIKKFKPKTQNLKKIAMEKYFKYVDFKDYEFKKVKIQQKTFCDNAINEKQYNKLIDWAKENSHKVWLIAKVIANTGVRVSELIELKTEDLGSGFTDILGKGGKVRRIYFPRSLVKEIQNCCGRKYIIENRYGEQMSTRGISQALKEAASKAGIPKEVMHPHSFRHFFAKQFLKKNDDITLLGDLLGHSDLSTTAIYTRMTSEEQKNKINKVVNW